MLKVKKPIQRKINNNNQDEYLKNQNDLKNAIKNLYIGNQNKKKTIDEYAQLTTQIREEYAKLQKENNQLKNTLEKYKQYIEEMHSPQQRNRFYEKPIRKTKFFQQDYKQHRYDEQENQESDDDYVTKFRQSKKPCKRIVYVDETDGDDEQSEPEIEPEIPEEEIKKPLLKKLRKEPKKNKTGIMKSIKNVTFLFNLIYLFFLINTRCKNLSLIKFK